MFGENLLTVLLVGVAVWTAATAWRHRRRGLGLPAEKQGARRGAFLTAGLLGLLTLGLLLLALVPMLRVPAFDALLTAYRTPPGQLVAAGLWGAVAAVHLSLYRKVRRDDAKAGKGHLAVMGVMVLLAVVALARAFGAV